MKVKKPTTYREWQLRKGEAVEVGAKMLLTDKLVKVGLNNDAIEAGAKQLASVIMRGMLSVGILKGVPDQWVQDDRCMRAKEVGLVIDGHLEGDELSYLYVAEEGWRTEYEKRIAWEERPLFAYFVHSLTRTKLGRGIRDWWDGRKNRKWYN